MEIRSLADTDFDTLYEAFSQAFADYEVQINGAQLRRMLKRRGFDARLSFAAFDGDRIAAFTLNGIGNYDGLPTAYDTGTGTLEAYRGQGLATRIFEHSIPYLKEAGIGRYLLEVLQHNTKAVSVYRKLGFDVTGSSTISRRSGRRSMSLQRRSKALIRSGGSIPGIVKKFPDFGISGPRGRTAPNPSPDLPKISCRSGPFPGSG